MYWIECDGLQEGVDIRTVKKCLLNLGILFIPCVPVSLRAGL